MKLERYGDIMRDGSSEGFKLPDKIEGELYLPRFEQIDRVFDILRGVGIDIKELFYGKPSIEDVKQALKIVRSEGLDPKWFFKAYPYLNNIVTMIEKNEIIYPEKIEGKLNFDGLFSKNMSERKEIIYPENIKEELNLEDLIKKNHELLNSDDVKFEPEKFLNFNVELSKLHIPNLTRDGENFLSNNGKLSELHFPSIEEHKRALEALENVGINMNDFYFGNPSSEEIAKAFKTLQDIGIDPNKYFSGHPYLADIELKDETKGKSV